MTYFMLPLIFLWEIKMFLLLKTNFVLEIDTRKKKLCMVALSKIFLNYTLSMYYSQSIVAK